MTQATPNLAPLDAGRRALVLGLEGGGPHLFGGESRGVVVAGRAVGLGQGGQLGHVAHRSFNVDRPNRTSIIVTIQNRTTTWDSLTPPTSKWWCSGAIRKIRRPSP